MSFDDALEHARERAEKFDVDFDGEGCVICGDAESEHDEDTGHRWTDDGAPIE